MAPPAARRRARGAHRGGAAERPPARTAARVDPPGPRPAARYAPRPAPPRPHRPDPRPRPVPRHRPHHRPPRPPPAAPPVHTRTRVANTVRAHGVSPSPVDLRKRKTLGLRQHPELLDTAVELYKCNDRRVRRLYLLKPPIASGRVDAAAGAGNTHDRRRASEASDLATLGVHLVERPDVIVHEIDQRLAKRTTCLLRVRGVRLEHQRLDGLATVVAGNEAEGRPLAHPSDLREAPRRLEVVHSRVETIPFPVDCPSHQGDAGRHYEDHNQQNDQDRRERHSPSSRDTWL
jgi:hypothetical protein